MEDDIAKRLSSEFRSLRSSKKQATLWNVVEDTRTARNLTDISSSCSILMYLYRIKETGTVNNMGKRSVDKPISQAVMYLCSLNF